MGREMMLRRARGYAPLPITINNQSKIKNPQSKILALGGHLKNTVAIAIENQVFLSQHIGDLETEQAFTNFTQVIASLQQLYEFKPEIIARDIHPDYLSTKYAVNSQLPVISIQHHYAHILACMAENRLLDTPVLGVAWDGTGYGLDGTIWGSEFILVSPNSCQDISNEKSRENKSLNYQLTWQRLAHLRQFYLPGGYKAVTEPRRIAMGLLWEIFGVELSTTISPKLPSFRITFTESEFKILLKILANKLNSPITSSMGRLFDGVAAILGLCSVVSFEGEAAMQLEFAIKETKTEEIYPFSLINQGKYPIIIDWQPILLAILADLTKTIPLNFIAAKFHNTLAEIVVMIASQIGISQIVLTGGCFQNQYLLETTVQRLRQANFSPYWHQHIPPNDGGIALGQAIAALLNPL
jgi:hydrogenase maturation protein HypF